MIGMRNKEADFSVNTRFSLSTNIQHKQKRLSDSWIIRNASSVALPWIRPIKKMTLHATMLYTINRFHVRMHFKDE